MIATRSCSHRRHRRRHADGCLSRRRLSAEVVDSRVRVRISIHHELLIANDELRPSLDDHLFPFLEFFAIHHHGPAHGDDLEVAFARVKFYVGVLEFQFLLPERIDIDRHRQARLRLRRTLLMQRPGIVRSRRRAPGLIEHEIRLGVHRERDARIRARLRGITARKQRRARDARAQSAVRHGNHHRRVCFGVRGVCSLARIRVVKCRLD